MLALQGFPFCRLTLATERLRLPHRELCDLAGNAFNGFCVLSVLIATMACASPHVLSIRPSSLATGSDAWPVPASAAPSSLPAIGSDAGQVQEAAAPSAASSEPVRDMWLDVASIFGDEDDHDLLV